MTIFRGSFKLNGPHLLISESWYTCGRLVMADDHLVSCLDSRANPYNFLQLKPGEAIVIRNVGGRVKSSLTDILALDTQFGLNKIIVVQHSNCGSSHLKENDVREHVKTKTEDSANAEAWEKAVMGYVSTPSEQCIKDDLALLQQQPHIRKELAESAVGMWLDVETGLLKEVKQ